eukprot:1140417-Pelagomonas_calceolata.AAC.1
MLFCGTHSPHIKERRGKVHCIIITVPAYEGSLAEAQKEMPASKPENKRKEQVRRQRKLSLHQLRKRGHIGSEEP